MTALLYTTDKKVCQMLFHIKTPPTLFIYAIYITSCSYIATEYYDAVMRVQGYANRSYIRSVCE